MSAPPIHVAIDGRLMFYRRAGIANYTRRLVQALAALRDEPLRLSVLLDRRDHDTAWLPAEVRVVRIVTPAHHPAEAWTLPLELAVRDAFERIDVLHSPDYITCRGRFRKVVTIHDLYFLDHPEVLTPASAHYYGRVAQSAQRADRVIAVSAYTCADVARLLPAVLPRTHVVLEAADEPTTAASVEALPPYALFVGTFEPRKNLATLLNALARTADDVRLVIVGEAGWVESEPAALARALGLQERVHFVGRVDDAELDRLYRGARMLLHPALSEGFGLIVLEAMQRGVPVICSDSGALPEVVADAALLHAPRDAEALAAHIMVLWKDAAARAALGERGRARAAEFSWRRAAHETCMVYRLSQHS
ncbi:MAG: glycosyltransferase family 1 protein [Chloroflexi bacterium]|nr:glycosyltransferase family 1 protein [Chloroflexota bacterium]